MVLNRHWLQIDSLNKLRRYYFNLDISILDLVPIRKAIVEDVESILNDAEGTEKFISCRDRLYNDCMVNVL